ncbi:carbamoyl-phosphate synthase L chain, N-terminal domain protein [Leptospira alexanderi serovar Manhao 3 str. L 60]|uniref:Carbamoyl-phosphate synthase L chain, N-terminal domain protein n=1 Tax=Leptospira alexanderi serovar Manhao 3 str. L 60 TaxID=1049759 RepID=V6HVZ8_9LEPT|nr:carbamoyl-phosphate synthase L chain, N-terminal domain protein [Leptospira alexanderi serovar Manhao 3 str. L 60]
MPRREDIRSVLILGSGPIVIGQACEFDYSGTQAAKALKEKGIRVILLNSNPATIMTDPDLADATYVEPMTVPVVQKILEKEKPDAILPTVGGQTALNLALACNGAGLLEKYNVELIGAKVDAIKKAEDRELFKKAMEKIGVRVPASGLANNLTDAVEIKKSSGFLSSFVPRLLSAVPEAESLTPKKLLRKSFQKVLRLLRSVRFFWKNRF